MKKLILLGATGSIGDSVCSVIRQYPECARLVAFSYHNNFLQARKIAKEFSVNTVCCTKTNISQEEKDYWNSQKVKLVRNLEELLEEDHDAVLSAVVGAVGLKPALATVSSGKDLMLANKEALVVAGHLLTKIANDNGAKILPVDSEHNSLFRLLSNTTDVEELILTASGGPFREKSLAEIKQATKKEVLNHPTWEMGAKITVDSAGMINKALEVMEAHYLFGFPYEKISAVIHPQSYVHAFIRHKDSSYSMHAAEADMRIPIAYCLFYPESPPAILPVKPANEIPTLTFEAIPKEKYPGFYLGVDAGKMGKAMPAVFNAANEVAANAFLQDKISFYQIPIIIEKTMEKTKNQWKAESIEEIIQADTVAREYANAILQEM
ncbi:MAG: 1-deoxy-D-xylulose-5-phosphate reductoisomerase [Candidatus Hydrogenedentota bacterium]|nr:MAG: 1-deoxy-D-xylulose-5-phosphate reductoisomerase [Candidatus Hydrogenedentota bacterium]